MMIEYVLLAAVFTLTVLYLRSIFSTQGSLPPGPLPLPVFGHLHLLSPLLHQRLHDLSFRYGPIFRLKLGSVECVIASSAEVAKEFLKTHELNFASRDHHSFAIDYLTYNKSFVFAPYGPYWRFVKKMCMSEVLGIKNLNQFRRIRTKEIQQFLHLLADKAKSRETLNVSEALLRLTNNIVSAMMLGIRCSGTKDEAEEARKIVREITKIIGSFNLSDFVWLFGSIDLQGYTKTYKEIQTRYGALLDKIIKDREEIREKRKNEQTSGEGEDHRKDFLDTLLDVLENDSPDMQLNKDNIKALILDFFTAGTDTSAIAIEWALVELINHPRVLEKARTEINEVVGTKRIVSESDISHLPYIQAIVKETLRLHPSIPMIARISREDWMVNGYKIPAKTLLLVNAWSIARDSKYWDMPLEFRPERFLLTADDCGADVKGQHFQLLPFGSGRRLCPGISLAMLELPTFVASVIQCFDLKATNLTGEEIQGDAVLDTSERPGLTVPRAQDLLCVPVIRSIDLLDQMPEA